jgi:hypothetical protein
MFHFSGALKPFHWTFVSRVLAETEEAHSSLNGKKTSANFARIGLV